MARVVCPLRVARVAALVAARGPVEGLLQLEAAEAVLWAAQAEMVKAEKWGTARGLEAAAYTVRGDQFHLVEVFG